MHVRSTSRTRASHRSEPLLKCGDLRVVLREVASPIYINSRCLRADLQARTSLRTPLCCLPTSAVSVPQRRYVRSAPSSSRMTRRWSPRAAGGPARRARATAASLLRIGLLICAVAAAPRHAGAVNIQDQVKDWLDWITGKASQPAGGGGSPPAEPPGSSRTLDCQPRAGMTTCLLRWPSITSCSHMAWRTMSAARHQPSRARTSDRMRQWRHWCVRACGLRITGFGAVFGFNMSMFSKLLLHAASAGRL